MNILTKQDCKYVLKQLMKNNEEKTSKKSFLRLISKMAKYVYKERYKEREFNKNAHPKVLLAKKLINEILERYEST